MNNSPIRLLLIEDSEDDAELVKIALARQAPGEFAVTRVHRLADALEQVRAEGYDVILSDLGLPDSTGLATAQAIAAGAATLPLVVLTGAHDEDLGRAAIQHGAQDYLVKGDASGRMVARTLRYAIERKHLEIGLRTANESLERVVAERTSELELAVKNLRESETRFRGLTELSSDWYWEQDRELRLSFHSSGFARRSGTTSNKLLGKRRWEEPDRYPLRGTWDEHRATLEAHQPFRDFEYVRIGDDGEQYFASLSGVPIYDAAGKFKGYRGVGTNITERKRAEQALHAAEEQFRGLVEQSIAGSYIIQDDQFAYVNPRFAEIFGYASADELIGRDPLSVVAENDRDRVAGNMRRRIEGDVASTSYEFVGVRKDGSMIEVGAHGAYATHLGRPAVIGLVQDISEKKRADEQVQRYLTQLEIAFMSTVQVATTLSEMRDPYTAGHERRVAEIAVAVGAELGFDTRLQEGLRVAGYLHDIGKITIPSEILSKPGKLSPIEYKLIQGHPQASHDVLKDVEFPWPVAQIVLHHHERFDGSGYPQGLKGEAILLEARIMAVADVVEAMSSHRPYRPGLGIDRALAEIERGRGSAYDPEVADACLRLFREKRYAIPS